MTEDLAHNIGAMTIYEKLGRMQFELANSGFTKSGSNNYQKYTYFELEDLLNEIIPLTIKYETTLIFSFTEHGVLKLKDWNPEKGEISIRVPFPEIESINRGTNRIQSTGAYITYLKRYLLVNMFLIMEKDKIEEEAGKETSNKTGGNTKSKKNTPKTKEVSEVTAGDPIQKVREYIHKKDNTIEITPVIINTNRMKMFKAGELTKEENRAVLHWYDKQKKEAKL